MSRRPFFALQVPASRGLQLNGLAALFVGLTLGLVACEDSPLSQADISLPNQSVSGQVRFDNNISPEGIYVWFQGFNLGTRTDQEGRFRFVLPPAVTQGAAGGTTGAFNIYYYVANFTLDSSTVAVVDGSFLYSQGELGSTGELNVTKILKQLLKIETSVQPASVFRESITVTEGKTDFIMSVEVALSAVRDSVIVSFPRDVGEVQGPLIFRNMETGEFKVLQSTVAGVVTSTRDTIDQVPTIRTYALPLFPDDLQSGEYEIIPYLFLEEIPLPAGLLESLSEDVTELGEGYLSMPFLRQGQSKSFTVR